MTRNTLVAVVLLLISPLIFAQEMEISGPFTSVETILCTGVMDRQPVGEAVKFDPSVDSVCLWSKFTGAQDTTVVKHAWFYNGKEMAVVELPVKSSSWRTWSYKTILPEWTGDWEVKIQDAEGNILKAVAFKIESAAPKTEREPSKEEPPSDSM